MNLHVYCVKVRKYLYIYIYTVISLKVRNQIINLQLCDVNFGLYLLILK